MESCPGNGLLAMPVARPDPLPTDHLPEQIAPLEMVGLRWGTRREVTAKKPVGSLRHLGSASGSPRTG